jgi:hypothetical protein
MSLRDIWDAVHPRNVVPTTNPLEVLQDAWENTFGDDAVLNTSPRKVTDEILDKVEQRSQYWSEQVHKQTEFAELAQATRKSKLKVHAIRQQDKVHRIASEQARRVITAEANGQIKRVRSLGASEVRTRSKAAIAAQYQQMLTGGGQ